MYNNFRSLLSMWWREDISQVYVQWTTEGQGFGGALYSSLSVLMLYTVIFPSLVWRHSEYRQIYSIWYVYTNLFNPLLTGDLKFYQSPGLSTFWGLFIFLIKQVYCRGSQLSSLFTIVQELMTSDHNIIIFVAPPSAWRSKWPHHDVTITWE